MLRLLSFLITVVITALLALLAWLSAADIPRVSGILGEMGLPSWVPNIVQAIVITIVIGLIYKLTFRILNHYWGLHHDSLATAARSTRPSRSEGEPVHMVAVEPGFWNTLEVILAPPSESWLRGFYVPLLFISGASLWLVRAGIGSPWLWGLTTVFAWSLRDAGQWERERREQAEVEALRIKQEAEEFRASLGGETPATQADEPTSAVPGSPTTYSTPGTGQRWNPGQAVIIPPDPALQNQVADPITPSQGRKFWKRGNPEKESNQDQSEAQGPRNAQPPVTAEPTESPKQTPPAESVAPPSKPDSVAPTPEVPATPPGATNLATEASDPLPAESTSSGRANEVPDEPHQSENLPAAPGIAEAIEGVEAAPTPAASQDHQNPVPGYEDRRSETERLAMAAALMDLATGGKSPDASSPNVSPSEALTNEDANDEDNGEATDRISEPTPEQPEGEAAWAPYVPGESAESAAWKTLDDQVPAPDGEEEGPEKGNPA